MKKLLGTATAIMFAAGLAVSANAQMSATPMAASGGGGEMHWRHLEHHPEIHHAKEKLEKAKYDLEHAAHDYGGHRVSAIQAIDGALHELNEALEYDAMHEHEGHEHH